MNICGDTNHDVYGAACPCNTAWTTYTYECHNGHKHQKTTTALHTRIACPECNELALFNGEFQQENF